MPDGEWTLEEQLQEGGAWLKEETDLLLVASRTTLQNRVDRGHRETDLAQPKEEPLVKLSKGAVGCITRQ